MNLKKIILLILGLFFLNSCIETTFVHMSEFINSKKFKDTKKKIINSKSKLEESFENVEKKSMDFYASVRSLYFQEKN